MDRRIGRALAVLFILLAHSRVEAACIEAGQLNHASVSIMRYLDEAEREARPGVIGIRGTSSFLSEPLMPEEEVVTFAYPGGRPLFVSGKFKQYGDDGKLAGTALLEMYEGDNRLVIDHGASGAPVVDCEGRIAAVVSNVFTQRLVFGAHEIRISTAWGMPNVVSVPIEALKEFSQAQ